MTIDESTINHNALRIISEVSDGFSSYDYTESELSEAKNFSYATMNYICGVFDMANAMKEVLETN